MNDMASASQPLTIDATQLQQARILSAQSLRPVVIELAALTGIDPRQLIQAMAAYFGLSVIETRDMLALTPAFDLLPLSKAMQRCSLLLRTAEGQLLGIIADPFDADLQTWLNSQAKMRPDTLSIRLALQADIQAYLSKKEESARAVDSLATSASDGRRDGKTTEVLSFASVSEAAVRQSRLKPPIRRLGRCLRVHPESTASGLAVVHIDGVLII